MSVFPGPPSPSFTIDSQHGFRLYDGTQNDYFQDGDLGVTCHLDTDGNAQFRGVVQASKIQGFQGGASGHGSRMWMDFTAGDPQIAPAGATPGVSPYWAITDNNGIIRVEAGFLAALGTSPLQWGLRANDPSGNPIFDSLGLIATANVLGSSTAGGSGVAGKASPPTGASGFGGELQLDSIPINLIRPANVLLIAMLNGWEVVPSGPFLASPPVYFKIDGTLAGATSQTLPSSSTTPNNSGNATILYVAPLLAAGAHVCQLIFNTPEGATDKVTWSDTFYIFGLGA